MSIVLLVCATVWLKCTEFKKQNLFAFIFFITVLVDSELNMELGLEFSKELSNLGTCIYSWGRVGFCFQDTQSCFKKSYSNASLHASVLIQIFVSMFE